MRAYMTHFKNIEKFPDDPILKLPVLFNKDPRTKKVNLGIGTYKDENGKPYVLSCVRKAEKLILDKKLDLEYLPIEGHAEFISSTLKFIFGKTLEANPSNHIFAMQSVGGTGALRIGAHFLSKNNFKLMYLSDPTWPNHNLIFNYAGMNIRPYPYYNPETHSLDFSGICDALKKMPHDSIVVLHASCHNPSGIDPTPSQWEEISSIIKHHHLIPFFDLAYQGFGHGIDEDAFPVRYFFEQGHEMFVASSYSKNLGLYGERVGLLSVITKDANARDCIASQLKQIVRSSYSMPPLQGARIAATIQNSPDLSQEWHGELAKMRNRIKEMRSALVACLKEKGLEKDMSFIENQAGIFSFMGINLENVKRLNEEFGIYMPDNGRINIAGLNWHNLEYVSESIASVLK